jgi:gluconolactonase
MNNKKSLVLFMFLVIIFIISFAWSSFSAGKSSGLVASGATLKTVQTGFNGTEGPATDADGNVWFTEVFGQKIDKWTWKDGKITLYRENTGKANGMMFDAKGNLVICEMGNGRVTRDDLKGNVTVVADTLNGKKMRMPNDLWIDPKGGIYISHMYMNLPTGVGMPSGALPGGGAAGGAVPSGARASGGPGSSATGGGISSEAPGEQAEGRGFPEPPSEMIDELGVVYISPDAKKVMRVTTDLTGPNGLIGTPDGKILYVGDRGKVWSYKINFDGTLSDKKIFCEKTTDGMAMDEKSNVYLTSGKFVLVYSPAGELIEEIAVPEGCSNVEFGGKDRKTLFITYQGYIYTLEMTVKGCQLPIDMAKGKK